MEKRTLELVCDSMIQSLTELSSTRVVMIEEKRGQKYKKIRGKKGEMGDGVHLNAISNP